MNYFTKIEAYHSGELNDVERSVFEQELAENATLQAEVAAYEMAQSLFGFTAETLPEEEIVGDISTATADEIITFAAKHLSEEQILGEPKQATQPTIIKQLKPRKNRIAWLAAASMLFIVSMIGLRFQSEQASWKTLGQNDPVAVNIPEIKVVEPLEKEVLPVIEEEKIKPLVSTTTTKNSIKKRPKTYEPASVKVVEKQNDKLSSLVANSNEVLSKSNLSNPLALNTTATEISSGKVIENGQTVVYKAESGIVLKKGFHVKAGSAFFATAASGEEKSTDFTSSATITGSEKVVYQSNETITLKPGFHAKAGTDFVAKTVAINTEEVTTNTVISDKESVLVKANNSITLKPGFHAKAGADFTATVAK